MDLEKYTNCLEAMVFYIFMSYIYWTMSIKKILNVTKNDSFAISLILLMVFSRLIPHPPNFTPIIAVAIMSSFFFKNLTFFILVMIISMFISDLFIGFYTNILFVYLPLILINFIFFNLSHRLNYKTLFLFSAACLAASTANTVFPDPAGPVTDT